MIELKLYNSVLITVFIIFHQMNTLSDYESYLEIDTSIPPPKTLQESIDGVHDEVKKR